jgi:hypothetical protein
MNTTTKQQETVKSTSLNSSYQTRQTRGLVAHWFKVDGKLVCKWFPADC